MEDCEVAVNGVMTFEAASLIEFSNTEQLRSLYNCKETYTLFIAYIDNRFTLLCTVSFYELCVSLKVSLNVPLLQHSQPTSYVLKLYIICNTQKHTYICFQMWNMWMIFSFRVLDPLLQFLLYPQDNPHHLTTTMCPHSSDVPWNEIINPLNAELNPVRHLLALVGARHIVHFSRIRVNLVLWCPLCLTPRESAHLFF